MVLEFLDSVKESIVNLGDKDKNITGAAFEKLKGMGLNSESLNWLTSDVVEFLLEYLEIQQKPSVKEYALLLTEYLVDHNPLQIKYKLSLLITAVSNLFWDTKDNIKELARNVFTKLLKCSGNKDLDPFLDTVYSVFSNPEVIEEGIEKLASCIFVQNVEESAISVIEPILLKGLKGAKYEIQRKSCIIIDNMC